MSTNENAENEPQADELSDELAKKYDPERLLRMVSRRAGRGDPLDASIRAKYEKRFGVDLGHVRVITGEFAEEFNKKRDAYAVTVGGTGMILMGGSPDKSMATASGQALLAHEITHVAQAQRGLHNRDRGSMEFTPEHEAEAHEIEHEVESEGQGASSQIAQAAQAELASAEALKQQIEKVKARVMEMMAEAARNQYLRNGVTRRP